jgi:hypothetical protein
MHHRPDQPVGPSAKPRGLRRESPVVVSSALRCGTCGPGQLRATFSGAAWRVRS